MIEITMTYDFVPGLDPKRYWEVCKRGTALLLARSNVIDLRAQRNSLGHPHVRISGNWKELSDWAAFAGDPEYLDVVEELGKLTSNMQIALWTESPIIPERLTA